MSHHDADPEVINAGNRPELGVEYRDVDLGKIGKASIWFFVFTIIMIVITIPIFWLLDRKEGFRFSEMRSGESRRIPSDPNPLLQSNATAMPDIHKLKQKQEQEKSSYGWVDRSKGVVRIPVEEAIKKVSEQGLPDAGTGGATNP